MKKNSVIKATILCMVVFFGVILGTGFVKAHAASQAEIEEKGVWLNLNEAKRDTFVKEVNEEKWYIFTIKQRGSFRINLLTTENTDGDLVKDGWKWTLYKKGNLNDSIKKSERNKGYISDYYFLEQGTYYLRISPEYSGAWNCEYEISVLFEESDYAEQEDNNTANQATELSKDKSFIGSISGEKDTDWYKICVDGTSAMSITFDIDSRTDVEKINYGWDIQIYDSTLKDCLKEYREIKSKLRTADLPVSKGDYYVLVKPHYAWSELFDCIYNISVSFDSGNWEAENNDQDVNATTLKPGEKNMRTGTLYKRDDVDWYKVKVTKNGYIKIKMTINDLEHRDWLKDGYNVGLYYDDLNEVCTFTFDSTRETQELPFKKGTYYLKVSANNSSGSPVDYRYGISVAQKSDKKWEREYNNELEYATPITLKGKTYKGVALRNGDTDYYVLSIKKNGEYTITLEKTGTAQVSEHGWNFEVLNASNERIGFVESITKTDSIKADLKPGKYYIKVSPDYKNGWFGYSSQVVGVVYKLTVKNK